MLKKIFLFFTVHHLLIARYFLVLAVIIGIALLFPRKNFNYDFELDQPWQYDNLYAPFTYTVNKSEDSIKREKKRVLDSIYPYYNLNQDAATNTKAQFYKYFERKYIITFVDTASKPTTKDSLRYIKTAENLIDSIYKKGIIDIDEEHQNKAPSKLYVNLMVSANKSSTATASDFFGSVPSACQYAHRYLKNLPDSTVTFLTDPICENLTANITYNNTLTRRITYEKMQRVVKTEGRIKQNELIIGQGQLVKGEQFQALISLRKFYDNSTINPQDDHLWNKFAGITGYFLISAIIIGTFVLFLLIFENKLYRNFRELCFVLLSVVLFVAILSFIMRLNLVNQVNISMYALPFSLIPIIIKNFFGSRVATYVHITIVLLAGFIVSGGYELLFLHFTAGLVAISLSERTHYWSQFFVSSGIILLTYILGYLGVSLIQESSWNNINYVVLGWLFVNTFFTLLAYPLIPVFEKLFGFVSDISLTELGDLNKPLLKELNKKAPGTFYHSLQVANLAEAAASEVGAKALLTKVGALYHDIGKMRRPAYFIENQKTAINPHDDLGPLESARIIKEHVTYGIELAKKERLPGVIIDFIRSHHGTTRIEYFYRKYVKDNPDQEVRMRDFCYEGLLPYSKETAIVMMADSIEAASRSLKNPTDEYIDDLVEKIIDGKIKQNQFVNCEISFKDVSTIKKVFKKQLRSIYHIRISYPEVARKDATVEKLG